MKIFTNATNLDTIDAYLADLGYEKYEYYVISSEVPENNNNKYSINYIPYDGFTLKLPLNLEITSEDIFFVEPSYKDALILMLLSGFGLFAKVYNVYKLDDEYSIDTFPIFRLVHVDNVWYPIVNAILKSLTNLIKVQFQRTQDGKGDSILNYNKYLSEIVNELELLSNLIASGGADYAKNIINDIFNKE